MCILQLPFLRLEVPPAYHLCLILNDQKKGLAHVFVIKYYFRVELTLHIYIVIFNQFIYKRVTLLGYKNQIIKFFTLYILKISMNYM